MIIYLDGGGPENVAAARQSLGALAESWGHELALAPVHTTAPVASGHRDDRVIDPVSLAALVVSIPSTALAVIDLADRIHKRRRAKDLIDHAQQSAAHQVTVHVVSHNRTVALDTLTPDQLLELLAGEGP